MGSVAFVCGYDKVKSRLVMDIQVEKNLRKLPGLIEEAVETTEEENRKTAKKNSGYGWSIISGSVGDSISYLQEKPEDFWRRPFNFGQLKPGDWEELYNIGFIASYGIGFGYPHLTAQALPSSKLGCGLEDYFSVLEKFNIKNGPKE